MNSPVNTNRENRHAPFCVERGVYPLLLFVPAATGKFPTEFIAVLRRVSGSRYPVSQLFLRRAPSLHFIEENNLAGDCILCCPRK